MPVAATCRVTLSPLETVELDGLVVMTEDRDFARFEGVSWERPLGG